MEPIDTEDGLPVWAAVEGCELPGGTIAIDRLGVGRRCETWLVWHPTLWCPAVLKLARPDQLNHPRAVKSLRRETAALAGNIHPAFPRLLADGTNETVPHLLIEYIDGPSLADELDENGALSPAEVALLGAQLLAAVRSLHHRGLAHLDLKPDNIVLRDSRPILIDFGSARPLGSLQPPDRPVGTLGYASPAQEACLPVTTAMDLYSLGQTLRESLANTPADAVHEVIRHLISDTPPESEVLLVALAEASGDIRPWPSWLDRYCQEVEVGVSGREAGRVVEGCELFE
jgi:serine/threonine protein kinase